MLKKTSLNLKKINTYSLQDRPSKVVTTDFAKPVAAEVSFKDWFDSLPAILASKDLKQLVQRMVQAKKNQRPIIWGMGSHVIKTGMAPLLIDLIDQGFISGLAFNGSALIHDFETAFAGKTSEDVDSVLGEGQFGMARETAEMVNEAINQGVDQGLGIGAALGKYIDDSSFQFKNLSLFAKCYQKQILATVHVAVGTDIIHMHERCDAAKLGLGSHRDFLAFAAMVAQLEGGVYLNWGSAVILPEIFLKSITLVRNLKFKVDAITTANFDFIQQYRERVNVVQRPTSNGGKGFSFTGHHELMLPILASALKVYGH